MSNLGKIANRQEALPTVGLEDPLALDDWDERIANHPSSTFFHSSAWAAVLQQTYGFKPIYFTSHNGSSPLNVLPVMEVNSWLTGKRGVSLPFTDQCEPLVPPSGEPFRLLFDRAVQYGEEKGWKYLELRGADCVGQMSEHPSPSLVFFGHRLRLSSNLDDILAGFETSVRRAIRKAEKANLRVEISQTAAATRQYYLLHCQTRKRHGLPPQPLKFFLNIHRLVLSRNMGIVVTAKCKERPVASAIFFDSKTEGVYKFGASDTAFQALRGNNLVMWEAIKWLVRQGKKALDFGRTSRSNEGLRRYKLSWGAEERTIRYLKFDLRRHAFITDRDDTQGWHVRIFRALPTVLSRMLGTSLYKHIA